MSKFSEHLESLVQARVDKEQATVYGIARSSRIDRSTLYKFMSGERLPANNEVLGRLLEALRLSPTQEKELRGAYAIARMGETRYLCRQNTLAFLNFFEQNRPIDPSKSQDLLQGFNGSLPQEGARVYTGQVEVNNLVQMVIGVEAAREHGEIRIIAQPEYEYLVHMLSSLTLGRPCAVHHILCLENETPQEDNQYNLNCLRAAVELCLAQSDYHPYYYYDNILSHFKNSHLLPYLILTSACAVQLSYDHQYAVCLHGAAYAAFFRQIFNETREHAKPLISKLETAPESLDFYGAIQQKFGPPRYSCACDPCLLPSLDRDTAQKYILEIPNRDAILDAFCAYVEQQNDRLRQRGVTAYFTMEGLDAFCRTGRIWQVPHCVYAPLEPCDRAALLRRYLEQQKSGFQIRLLRPDRLSMPRGLEIAEFQDNHIAFVYARSTEQHAVVFLHEKSLSACFEDFFTYIKEDNLAYSVEQSRAVLCRKIEELQAET